MQRIVHLISIGSLLTIICLGDQCPDGYSEMGGMCLMMGKPAPWNVSQTTCEKAGATMFIMKDKTQWDILKVAGPSELTTIWIGLHYEPTAGIWKWSDSSIYDMKKDWAPWGQDQPKLTIGQCVIIKTDMNSPDKSMAWYSSKCDSTMTTVCIKALPSTVGTGTPFTIPTFEPISCAPGLFGFGGHCLKYSKNMVTFANASVTCANVRGYVLFTREKRLWDYATYYLGSQLSNFWVGIFYNRTAKQFQWSDGQSYVLGKDWAPWGPDQPGKPDSWAGDCVNTVQDFNTGQYNWIMADCEQALNGICIIDIETSSTSTTTLSMSSSRLSTSRPMTSTAPSTLSTTTTTSSSKRISSVTTLTSTTRTAAVSDSASSSSSPPASAKSVPSSLSSVTVPTTAPAQVMDALSISSASTTGVPITVPSTNAGGDTTDAAATPLSVISIASQPTATYSFPAGCSYLALPSDLLAKYCSSSLSSLSTPSDMLPAGSSSNTSMALDVLLQSSLSQTTALASSTASPTLPSTTTTVTTLSTISSESVPFISSTTSLANTAVWNNSILDNSTYTTFAGIFGLLVDVHKWPWYIPFSIGSGAVVVFCVLVALCACICCRPRPARMGIYPYYP